MIIFEYQNSILLIVELDWRCHYSRWYPTTYSFTYTLSTSWTTILREQYSLSQLGHIDCYLFSLLCSSLWIWKAHFLKGQSSKVWHVLSARTNPTTFPSTTHWNSSQLLIHFTTVAMQYPPIVLMLFPSYVYLLTCCDCDCNMTNVMLLWLLWLSHDAFPHSTLVMIYLNKRKKNEK